jgi:integrase
MERRKMAAIRHLKVVSPANVKCTVALPVRKPNAAYRSREHLTEREVEQLIEAAKDNRWGHRDSTMALLAFRHGLRASELVDLRWGAGGLGKRHPARPQGQTGHSGHASPDGP